MADNPVGIRGIEFVEFASTNPKWLDTLFKAFGFCKVAKHDKEDVLLYEQGDMKFLLNNQPGSFSLGFEKTHGPCISSMGWRVDNAERAFAVAVERGAKPAPRQDYLLANGKKVPAILGIGDSLIYFMEPSYCTERLAPLGYKALAVPEMVPGKGFVAIDHLTNNVFRGTMDQWTKFYKEVFGFTEIRYFDIRGIKTGLVSFALRSPDGSFAIPINEGTEKKSQINEFLDEYKGPGVQHLALLTNDILATLRALEGSPIKTLEMDPEYYDSVFDRVPHVTEDRKEIRKFNVLVDGDDKGYLLQLFTKNLVGPIFIEIIQRKNNHAFGEGNFGALFRAIERDQEARGVL